MNGNVSKETSRILCAAPRNDSLLGQDELVIEAEFTLWHARQIGPHEDLTIYIGSQHCPLATHKQIDSLDDIDKGFILAILDISTPPASCTSSLNGDLGTVFSDCLLRLDAFGGDVHLESVRLTILWVSKVEDFIQQLVKEDKVVLDTFFIELAKVAPSNLYNPVAELKDEGSIGIALCHCDDVKILMPNVEERGAAQCHNGRADVWIRDDLNPKDVGNRPSEGRGKRASQRCQRSFHHSHEA